MGLVPSVNDTNRFSCGGYKLASRLLRSDKALIDALTKELCERKAMKKEELKSWLDSHAEPLLLDALELTTTF